MHIQIDENWSAEVQQLQVNRVTGETKVTEPTPEQMPEIHKIIEEKIKTTLPQIRMMSCEMCGKKNDCRPYGPKGEDICVRCCAKNPMIAYAGMREAIGVEAAEELMKFLKHVSDNPTEAQPEADFSKMN